MDNITTEELAVLFKRSNKAIIAFINETDKKVWISPTNNAIEAIVRYNKQLLDSSFKLKELVADYKVGSVKVCILETFDSTEKLETMLARAGYWERHYLKLSFSLYSKAKKLSYRLIEKPITIKSKYYMALYASTKSGKKAMLGVFTTKQAVDSFIAKNYPDSVDNLKAYIVDKLVFDKSYESNMGRYLLANRDVSELLEE